MNINFLLRLKQERIQTLLYHRTLRSDDKFKLGSYQENNKYFFNITRCCVAILRLFDILKFLKTRVPKKNSFVTCFSKQFSEFYLRNWNSFAKCKKSYPTHLNDRETQDINTKME